MPERDGYIPGVPCWVDAPSPTPTRCRVLQRPVRLGARGRDARGRSGAKYLTGRIGGGDVAAISSIGGAPRPAALEHVHLGRERRRDGRQGPRRRRQRRRRAVRRLRRRADGRLHRSRGRGVLRLAGQRAQGLTDRQRARNGQLQQPQYPRPRGCEGVLQRGLRLEDLDLGGGAEMLTLPGYGDHLEELNPGLRERIEEMGGPPRASRTWSPASTRSRDDQPDTPPHWNVTFAVDDADASAREGQGARRHRCSSGRSTRPGSRMAMSADPAGATFIASQFVLENKDLGAEAAPS